MQRFLKQFVKTQKTEYPSHSCRPHTIISDSYIKTINMLIDGHRCLTISEIALEFEISFGSMYAKNITDDTSVRLVPHLLADA